MKFLRFLPKTRQNLKPLWRFPQGSLQLVGSLAISSLMFLSQGKTAAAQTVVEDVPSGGISFGSNTHLCNTFLTRNFTVTDDFIVSDISIGLNISHASRGFIGGFLVAPNNSNILFLNVRTDANDNYDVLFVDGGGAINDGNADNVNAPFYERTANPSNAFANLTGQSSQGTWSLLLCDTGSGVQGTYNRSQLTLSPADLSGFAFDDVIENATRDSNEGGLADISVRIYQDDGDNIFEPNTGDTLITTVQTGANGGYGTDLPTNGNYWVDVDETDADLAGRSYGGSSATNTEDPRLISFSGAPIEDVDFPFVQDLGFLCPAGDPTESLAFLEGASLESGTDLQIGAIYRFPNVFNNVDALVEVASFNNGASLAAIDNDTTGVGAAFQPTLNAISGTTSSVDFNITLVITGTTQPVAFTFRAAGVDIDGDGGDLREFIELTNLNSFELSSPTSLIASSIPDGNRFESATTAFQPGVSATAEETLVVAEYNRVSEFRYTIGAIDSGTSGANQRLNSLFFGCTNGPIGADLQVVKRITAINGDRTENPNDNTPLNAIVNDGVANSSDDNSDWPSNYLIGAINGGTVRPGDELEYTVYFINPGGTAAQNVRLCDLIPDDQTFTPGVYNGNDLEISINGTVDELTAANDAADRIELTQVGSLPATPGCNLPSGATNADDVVVLDLTGSTGLPNNLTTLPRTTGQGTPNNAFGFFRYTTTLDE